MAGRSTYFLVMSFLVLAGCQTADPGSTPPAEGQAAASPAAAAPAANTATEEGRLVTCSVKAAAEFKVPPSDVATSNEYPLGTGTAIDGSVTAGAGGNKQFRCEFDGTGAFQRVAEVPAA